MLETKIVGYSDEISVAPGERLRFMVSCEAGVDHYQADIVRLISGDRQPGGPGYRDELLDTPVSGTYPAREQATYCGSCGVVPHSEAFEGLQDLSVQATIRPSLPGDRPACIISKIDESAGTGFSLWTDPDDGLLLQLGDGAGSFHEFKLGRPLIAREWYLVSATYDAASGAVSLRQELLESYARDTSSGEATHACPGAALVCDAPLLIAAICRRHARGEPVGEAIFNGRIERPVVVAEALDRASIHALRAGPIPLSLRSAVRAAWDFSKSIQTDDIIDISPNNAHGRVVNLPIRAVRGSTWTGEEMNFRHAPDQYAAIHFLEDSLYDAGWEPDFELEVPAGTRSGLYAARIVSGDQEDHIPFVIRPPRDRATAPLLLVIPTASYMAYANSRGTMEGEMGEIISNSLAVVSPQDRHLNRHPEYGNSMYDDHADGTGVCYSSRLRPILNFRPTHPWLWQLAADMHLIEWLESQDFDFDVITDEDLHKEGAGLLNRYRCVMTGSHPEYYSTPMWDAVYAFTQRGGRLIYMGGNGFYWRVAFRDDKPGAMEMRRTEDGSRSWASEPGEYYMSFTGEYGGLWWRAGRTPQYLVGNGFIAQGFDISSYFRRTPESSDPRAAFIFEGIDDEIIGDFGLIGGGAAGLELDSADRAYGTPPHALTVASSENHTDAYIRVNEDLGHMNLAIGGMDDPKVRADLVFFETPNGGAVFSTGSIGWASALWENQHDNNVSRLTRNVVDRFLDPAPFE